jgi:hypothetical protein
MLCSLSICIGCKVDTVTGGSCAHSTMVIIRDGLIRRLSFNRSCRRFALERESNSPSSRWLAAIRGSRNYGTPALERRTNRDGSLGQFVQPDLVLVVLRIERDLPGCDGRVGGVVCRRRRDKYIVAVAPLCA